MRPCGRSPRDRSHHQPAIPSTPRTGPPSSSPPTRTACRITTLRATKRMPSPSPSPGAAVSALPHHPRAPVARHRQTLVPHHPRAPVARRRRTLVPHHPRAPVARRRRTLVPRRRQAPAARAGSAWPVASTSPAQPSLQTRWGARTAPGVGAAPGASRPPPLPPPLPRRGGEEVEGEVGSCRGRTPGADSGEGAAWARPRSGRTQRASSSRRRASHAASVAPRAPRPGRGAGAASALPQSPTLVGAAGADAREGPQDSELRTDSWTRACRPGRRRRRAGAQSGQGGAQGPTVPGEDRPRRCRRDGTPRGEEEEEAQAAPVSTRDSAPISTCACTPPPERRPPSPGKSGGGGGP